MDNEKVTVKFTGARTTQMTFSVIALDCKGTFGPSNELQRSLGHGFASEPLRRGSHDRRVFSTKVIVRRRKSLCSRSQIP
jgi:hypothetical protein